MKRLVVALALVGLAFPAGSIAAPDERVRPPRVAPVLAPHLPATGTDVASPDQQSPIAPPASAPASGGSGFDWSDAGIGAGSAIVLLALSLAAGLTFRRRRGASALAG